MREKTKLFSEEYLKLKPKSGNEYERKKLKGSPRWKTLAAKLGAQSWDELVKKLGLPVYGAKKAAYIVVSDAGSLSWLKRAEELYKQGMELETPEQITLTKAKDDLTM